jgi:tripartite motif-containing protein 25
MLAEDFEDELTCPVCLMLFTDPRTLPCGNSHNVCLECAKGLWQNKSNQVAANSITCPVCRANCVCPSGVERLPLNLALKNMVEKLEAAQKGKSLGRKPSVRRKFKCDVCEKKAAVMECVTCVVKYCDACLETCHPKERAVFKAHVVTPMEPVSGRSCETHEGQALSFFCTQCGVMVCAHCLLMGAHMEHPRVSLHTAVADRKAQVRRSPAARTGHRGARNCVAALAPAAGGHRSIAAPCAACVAGRGSAASVDRVFPKRRSHGHEAP